MRVIQIASVSCGLFFLILFTGRTKAQSCESKENIPCENGQCIPRSSWCDENKDCADGSDENYCKKKKWYNSDPNDCESMNYFLCDNGQCVPSVATCDDHSDCKDGSDEFFCKPENFDYEDLIETDEMPPIVSTTKDSSLIDPSSEETDFEGYPNNIENKKLEEKTTAPEIEIAVTQTPIKPSTSLNTFSSTTKSSENDFYKNKMIGITKTLEYESQAPGQTKVSDPVVKSSTQEASQIQIGISTPRYTSASPVRQTNTPQHRHTHPTQQRPTYPTQQRPTYPTQQRPTYPTQQRPTYPTQQRPTHPTPPPRVYSPQPPHTHYTPERHSLPDRPSHTYPPHERFSTAYPQHSNNYVPQPQQPQYNYSVQPVQPRYPPIHPQQPIYPPVHPQQSRYPPVQPEQTRYPPSQPQQSRYPPVQPQQHRHPPVHPQQSQYSSFHPQRPENQLFINNHRFNGNGYNGRRSDNHDTNTFILTPRAYTGHFKAPAAFHFNKNYTRQHRNEHSIKRAYEWLLEIRDANAGWGKDTPRALIALSLVNNSFAAGTLEVDVLKKYFQVYLGVKLLKPETINKNRLAIFTNALLATCQNPKDFHGIDLTDVLRKQHHSGNTGFLHPFIYLSLCLADVELSAYDVHALQRKMNDHILNYDQPKDMLSFAIMAFSCHMQHLASSSTDHAYRRQLEEILNHAVLKLLEARQNDGSFGSIYSTALAAQALLSVNDSRNWDMKTTFDFLKQHQTNNGSFGDLLATYYVLPVLSGRSLLHLRNTHCNPLTSDRELTPVEILEFIGPRQYIRYSLHFGLPLTNSYSVDVHVPVGITFFDVMRVAEYQNKHFKFSYEVEAESISVYSISDLPNDSEKGFAWHLYIKRDFGVNASNVNNQELYTGDIRKMFPTADQHFIFWYHPIGYRA